MNILIGTPVHQVKDYSMKRWLENVAKLQLEYPADLFMVDNSTGLNYVEKVRGYCQKYGVKNYRIKHAVFDPAIDPDERIERSQEIIRQEVLSKEYDAWFSWECDQIIPVDALNTLVELMNLENFMMVNCNSWARKSPNEVNTDLGCVLIKRECLEKTVFLQNGNRFQGIEGYFKVRALKNGSNYLEVYGIINPVYHLDE